MNVTFDKLNSADVTTKLGVSPQTVTAWCRRGYIKGINLGDGTEKARYMFSEEEVDRVRKLIDKHGTRKWMLYAEVSKQPVVQVKEVQVPFTDVEPQLLIKPKFDPDKVMNKILEIRELKERLENLEAERNQVENEINALKQEIMEVL